MVVHAMHGLKSHKLNKQAWYVQLVSQALTTWKVLECFGFVWALSLCDACLERAATGVGIHMV